MSLPYDFSRCIQHNCPVAPYCARYRDRADIGPRTPFMAPQDFDGDGCQSLILTDEGRALKDAQLDAFRGEMRSDEEPADTGPYCIECGSTDLAFVEQYADGSDYRCRGCGNVAQWIHGVDDEGPQV